MMIVRGGCEPDTHTEMKRVAGIKIKPGECRWDHDVAEQAD